MVGAIREALEEGINEYGSTGLFNGEVTFLYSPDLVAERVFSRLMEYLVANGAMVTESRGG